MGKIGRNWQNGGHKEWQVDFGLGGEYKQISGYIGPGKAIQPKNWLLRVFGMITILIGNKKQT